MYAFLNAIQMMKIESNLIDISGIKKHIDAIILNILQNFYEEHSVFSTITIQCISSKHYTFL